MDERHLQKRTYYQAIKRVAISILCCIPLLCVVGYFLLGRVSNAVMIVIFMCMMITVLGIVELVHARISAKRAQRLSETPHRDVFR